MSNMQAFTSKDGKQSGVKTYWEAGDSYMKGLSVVLAVAFTVLTLVVGVGGVGALTTGSSGSGVAPPAEVSASYNETTQTLNLTHEEGASLSADNLSVRIDKEVHSWPANESFTSGDTVKFENIKSYTAFEVYWQNDGENVTVFWMSPA